MLASTALVLSPDGLTVYDTVNGVTWLANDSQGLAVGAADKLSASIIEKRLNYWSWLLAPKFSEKDRKAVNLQREYPINQV